MNEADKQTTIAKMADEYAEQFKSRWFHLGTITHWIERRCQTEKETEIVRLSLPVVRRLVARGFRAGEPSTLGYRFWPEKDADAIIARITRKVDEIGDGHHPMYRLGTIGNICYFGRFEMDEAAKQAELVKLAQSYCADKGNDQSELAALTSRIRNWCGIESNEEVKRLTLKLVRTIVNCGLRVGSFKLYSDEPVYWPEQDIEAVVARIDREWDPKRGDPTPAEPICWFE